MLTIDELKDQLKQAQQELENNKAQFYRADGCVQLLKYQIKLAEDKPTPETKEAE